MTSSPVLTGSRFDKIADTQKIFRIMLDAMARPGKIYQLPPVGWLLSNNSSKFASFETLSGVLATLIDHEVTFCLLGNDDSAMNLTPILSAATGSRSVTRDKADYVATLEAPETSLLSQLNPGSLLYPNIATTLISRVENLANEAEGEGNGTLLALNGPGAEPNQKLWVAGTNATFFNTLSSINAGYPTGLDIIWATPSGKLVGLPRSTRITVVGGQ